MGNSLSRPDDPYSRTRRSWDIPRNTKDRITKTASSKVKETKRTAWATLETTLHLLERSSDAFPLLKSAVADLIGCLDIIQVCVPVSRVYKLDLLTLFECRPQQQMLKLMKSSHRNS